MIKTNPERDNLLTDFGKETLHDRYLQKGESTQDLFARVAAAYADDEVHGQRVYDYISNLWFMPATPILSNGGTERGLPISCYLNHVQDSISGIKEIWGENVELASRGGGIGTYWGGVRSIGEAVRGRGTTSGIIPFLKVMDSQTLAVSQGSLRRGSAAGYISIHHPEIEEFIDIRKPSGDFNRRCLNLHHGVMITNEFMEAVKEDLDYELRSPFDGSVLRHVSARDIWVRLLESRVATGEPYIVFSDTVNDLRPSHHKKLNLYVSTSNLCSEITLPTGIDHLGNDRTAVCCLSSLNLETFDQWSKHPSFIEDVMRFLDNVIEDFINKAPDEMSKARYSAQRERSVGLGVMGFHSFLQSKNIAFESALAKAQNIRIFQHIKTQVDAADLLLAEERGSCPDAIDAGEARRFSNKTAIAPTASISIIAGGTSACIEPIPANIYTHKTLSGSFSVKNKYLDKIITEHCIWEEVGTDGTFNIFHDNQYDTIWDSILENEGSVQHLDFLTDHQKNIFKTSFEINQRWLIEFGADRAPLIDQAQSLNLFIPADVNKWDLHMLHFQAWEKGIKSLYYLRSKSVQRAAFAGGVDADNTIDRPTFTQTDFEECLACQ